MELKQLEFFCACVEWGSLSKSAERLYTSQPNMSKVIRSLENELGSPLFERTSKGLQLTAYGKEVYDYALGILKNVDLMKGLKDRQRSSTFDISTYPSIMMANLLVKLYHQYKHIGINHREGNVEEIICHVEQAASEIGVLYVSKKHLTAFFNILARRKICFVPLANLKACLYAGPNSSVYSKDVP